MPLSEALTKDFTPITIGQKWASAWESAWFIVSCNVDDSFANEEIGLWFDCDGEACVFEDASPWQGLTPKVDWYHNAAKYFVPLCASATPHSKYEIIIEAAANDLFGSGKEDYLLRECALVNIDRPTRELMFDCEVLYNLATSLPVGSLRRQRIIYEVNQAIDIYESEPAQTKTILAALLAKKANQTALTAYSIGHAHLDLAWLWPLRESKRKGGRTFANALRLLEAYPQYRFGASQAQLYQWIKELYPVLYENVKQAIAKDLWEVQGASWVEFDTNLISGESIIRQFLYGKRFFTAEFGKNPSVLWLPDCFGFSGNLPQIMLGCEVDKFMTQKLSWNETNTFAHHLFIWQGIDGSEVLAHQLPTNDYNFSNQPSAFLQTETRYAQAELCDGFLNLYGIGDGGGGPTLNHIEYGLRLQDLEGTPKFKFAFSADFWASLSTLDLKQLPKTYGELYLEYHRGTYTTQALMKEHNFRSESMLKLAEFIACHYQKDYPTVLRKIWEDTLLLQFHDIIPGSSIAMVYDDARQISSKNHAILNDFCSSQIKGIAPDSNTIAIVNSSGAELKQWVAIADAARAYTCLDHNGCPLPAYQLETKSYALVTLPPWSMRKFTLQACPNIAKPTRELPYSMENQYLKVQISPSGSITSIIDKALGTEVLATASNVLKLWQDEPNNWGAWDINHFYRDSPPRLASEVIPLPEICLNLPGIRQVLAQRLIIGYSSIVQQIELNAHEPFIRIKHQVDWQEKHQMLRVHFYPDIHHDFATYDIQFGSIRRSAKPKNSFEQAMFEVPAHRFADLSNASQGCAILSKHKYGYRIVENEMELNLLRSPADVDPHADIHYHEYEYAFYPHQGDFEHSDLYLRAKAFATDAFIADATTATDLPQDIIVDYHSDGVYIESIKIAENEPGIIIRAHEYRGGNATLSLTLNSSYATAKLCNLIEIPQSELTMKDRTIRLSFKPFEIKTLLFQR